VVYVDENNLVVERNSYMIYLNKQKQPIIFTYSLPKIINNQ
jgi:hypothetical protein